MKSLRQHGGASGNRRSGKFAHCDRNVGENRRVDDAFGLARGHTRGHASLAKPSISHQQAAECCHLSGGFLPGYAFGMAVSAFHRVNVVRTL